MNVSPFFDESTEQSRLKAEIVAKYLRVWAKIVIPTTKKIDNRIGYIDLFSGTGKYKDNTKSTPLLILERTINDKDMRDMLVTVFNDSEPENIKLLKANINSLAGIKTLKYKPQVYTNTVDEDFTEVFRTTRLIPSLTFLDPWGYKGLSYELINSVIKDWGCECIVFFNYNRINMGLNNSNVKKHIDALFGVDRANELRNSVNGVAVDDREYMILNSLEDTMKEIGGEYMLPFRFRSNRGNRISHHLVFISKNRKGYDIMKDIMARGSSSENQGVPSFEYSPIKSYQPNLFQLNNPLDSLKESILKKFSGQTIQVRHIFNQHNVGTPYIERNYKEVLKELEKESAIKVTPCARDRRPNTMGDRVNITFA